MRFLKLNSLTCRPGNISRNGQGHDLQSASYHTPFDSTLPLQLFLPAISRLPVKPFTWKVMSVPTLTCIIVMMERSRVTYGDSDCDNIHKKFIACHKTAVIAHSSSKPVLTSSHHKCMRGNVEEVANPVEVLNIILWH